MTVPRFKVLEERVTGALPVPVRLIVCGLFAALARFVNVTVLAALVLPTAKVPKLKVLDERVTDALPVPVRLTVCVPALSAMVRLPETEPMAVGVKETSTLQEVASVQEEARTAGIAWQVRT